MSEVEETLQRIKSNSSVQGYIIINFEGAIIKSTYSADKKEEGEMIAKNYHQLCLKAKSIIRDLDPIVYNHLIIIIIIIRMILLS